MQFAEQTLTRRDGQPVVYRFHVGPNRAERRRQVFGRKEIAERKLSSAREQKREVRAWCKALSVLGAQ